MSDRSAVEFRPLPDSAELLQAARERPGEWVYDIDHAYPATQRVPAEAIRGAWETDSNGKLTGRYTANGRYRALIRSAPLLKPYMHAGAKTNRDQWIVEIDPRGERLFPDIPPNLIKGWWYVNHDGVIAELFRPNSEWIDDALRDVE